MIQIDGFEITYLSDADQPAIDDLYARCADFVALDPNAGPPSALLHSLPADGVPERESTFGLWRDGVLRGALGMLRGYREEKDWWIGLLMLDPTVRGQGVGRAALEEVLRLARESKVAQTLWLLVAFRNTRALQFWQREGFVERSRTETHFMLSRGID